MTPRILGVNELPGRAVIWSVAFVLWSCSFSGGFSGLKLGKDWGYLKPGWDVLATIIRGSTDVVLVWSMGRHSRIFSPLIIPSIFFKLINIHLSTFGVRGHYAYALLIDTVSEISLLKCNISIWSTFLLHIYTVVAFCKPRLLVPVRILPPPQRLARLFISNKLPRSVLWLYSAHQLGRDEPFSSMVHTKYLQMSDDKPYLCFGNYLECCGIAHHRKLISARLFVVRWFDYTYVYRREWLSPFDYLGEWELEAKLSMLAFSRYSGVGDD